MKKKNFVNSFFRTKTATTYLNLLVVRIYYYYYNLLFRNRKKNTYDYFYSKRHIVGMELRKKKWFHIYYKCFPP